MGIIIYSFILLVIFFAVQNATRYLEVKSTFNDTELYTYKVSFAVLFPCAIYIIVRSLDFDTGTDYMAYYQYYKFSANGSSTYWGEGREAGYKILVKVLGKISKNPELFFGFCALLWTVAITKISKVFGKPAPYIILSWFMFMFVQSMNLYRQYISLSLLLLLYYTWLHNVKYKYFYMAIIVALCVSFHTSALIRILCLVLIYLLSNFRIDRSIFIILVILSSIASKAIIGEIITNYGYISDSLMDNALHAYYSEDILETMYSDSRVTFVNMVAFCTIIFYADKYLRVNSQYTFLYYVLCVCFIVEPLTHQEILMRMRLYLDNFMIIGFGILLYESKITVMSAKKLPLFLAVLYLLYYNYIYACGILFENYPFTLI